MAVAIILSDDSGKSFAKKVFLQYGANLSLKEYHYSVIIPPECSPMKNITYVELICPSSHTLYFSICNDVLIPSRERTEMTGDLSGNLTEFTIRFNTEVLMQLQSAVSYKVT